MTGVITGHRRGVNIITGDDGATYYNYGLPLRTGTEVVFSENSYDDEVADDVRAFPIDGRFSLKENIISGVIGILIGAAIVFFATKPVHAAELTHDEISLVAQVVRAEAENQDLLGKRLVADVVLNRVEHEDFPGTVKEVIYQPGQFEPVENGKINRDPDEESLYAVKLELNKKTNESVLFFRTKRYPQYGKPAYQVGEHYFSDGEEPHGGNHETLQ